MRTSFGSIDVTSDHGETFLVRGEILRDDNNKIIEILNATCTNTTGKSRFPQPSQEVLALGDPDFVSLSTKEYMEAIRD